MTTAKTSKTFRLPDRPERGPDDMTSYRQLSATSIIGPLQHYLGRRETTLITGDQYLCRVVTPGLAGARYPDLLIAFNADLDSHRRRNGYVIADQGKPPDFVLEIASAKTGRADAGSKRRDYAGFGIPEYWRFDETPAGRWHGARLAGDRLARGRYEPIPIEQLPGDVLQGYSQVLNINLRWENGELLWYDPVTGRHIPTFHEERERADQEYGARLMAQQRADQERQARSDGATKRGTRARCPLGNPSTSQPRARSPPSRPRTRAPSPPGRRSPRPRAGSRTRTTPPPPTMLTLGSCPQ